MATDSRIISFKCDKCRQLFEVPAIYAGRSAVCKGCGKTLVIPSLAVAPARNQEPDLRLDDRGHMVGPDGEDSPDFEYGVNGTIYYAEPPRGLEAEEAEDFALEESGAKSSNGPKKEGLLDFTTRVAAGAEPDAPLHMVQAETMLRRALAKHAEAQKAIAAERERNSQQQQIIELEKQEKLRRQRATEARRAKFRTWRVRVLGVAIVVYGALAYTGRIGDWLVLWPTRDAILVPLERSRQIPMAAGNVLEVWTARSPGLGNEEPEAYVLALCGNDERAETAASMALDRFVGHKVEVWSPNYPGFGGSSGRASLQNLVPTATVTYDVLHNVIAKGRPIFLTGENIGSAVALQVAAQHRAIDGVLLYEPAPLKDLMLQRYGWFNLWIVGGPVAWFSPSELDTVPAARKVQAPAVFIIAGADSLVPSSYQMMVADACASEHKIVSAPNDGHDALASGRGSHEATDWLFQTVANSRKAALPPATRPAH